MDNREVFISYARVDGLEFARELEKRIENETKLRTEAFFDKSDLKLGDYWERRIDKAIEDCFVMVVVLTQGSRDSKWVTYEWASASAKGKPIIPLILDRNLEINDPELHGKLKDFQLDHRQFLAPQEEDWKKLLYLLEEIYRQTHIPVPVQRAMDAAEDWRTDNRDEALDFLKNHKHHSTFVALSSLCESDFPDTAKLAAYNLGAKIYNQPHGIWPHPFIDRDALLSKAFEGMENAILDIRLCDSTLGLLQKFNTPEAVNIVSKAYRRSEDSYSGRIINGLINFENPAVVPMLREISLIERSEQISVLKRLTQFEDEETLPIIFQYCTTPHTPSNAHRQQMKLGLLKALKNYKTLTSCQTLLDIVRYYGRQCMKDHRDGDSWSMARTGLEVLYLNAVSNNLREAMDLLFTQIVNAGDVSILNDDSRRTLQLMQKDFKK
jgi:hypothetical protein